MSSATTATCWAGPQHLFRERERAHRASDVRGDVKERPVFDPLIVHVAAPTAIAELVVEEDAAKPPPDDQHGVGRKLLDVASAL